MCIGSSSSPSPAPPPVVAPPAVIDTTKDNAASLKARQDQAKAARLRGGRESTILTSPLGLQGEASTEKVNALGLTSKA